MLPGQLSLWDYVQARKGAAHNFRDLSGRRFGRLLVVRRVDNKSNGKAQWECKCDCGNDHIIQSDRLLSGKTQSCGCFQLELLRTRSIKHGHGRQGALRSPEYRAWSHIITRCENKNVSDYHLYGGRGIRVCGRWRSDFAAFLEDMGRKPSPLHSIDRVDNDGHYEPGNCRWATAKEQARNRRSNRIVEVSGEAMTMAEAIERQSADKSTVYRRLAAGDNITEALARASDPQTSHDAARSVNTTMLEAAVYGCLKAHGPKTSFEIADILRLSLVTVSPRLRPLADKGLVRDSGVRRLGQSGKRQIVWEITKE